MKTTRSPIFGCVAATFLVAATLTGCDAGTADPPEADPDISAPDPGAEAPREDVDGPDCLIGDWVATEAALGEWYAVSLNGVEGVTIESVNGAALLSFSDSEYIYSSNGVSIGMSLSDQEMTTVLVGGVGGSYTAGAGGILSTQIEASDFDARVTVSGIEFSAQEMGIDMIGGGSFAGYECDDDGLLLETPTGQGRTAFLQFIPAG